MTSLLKRADPWSVQPGWGIHVDLTPPELLSSRQVRMVRQLVITVLVAVVLLCAGGYVLALRDRSTAEDGLANAQLVTTQLQQRATKYNGITEMEGKVTEVRAQIASLMKGDVALDAFFTRMLVAVPSGLKIAQVAVTISPAGVAGGQAPTTGVSVDNTGHPLIGKVTVSGPATSMNAVALYADHLRAIAGVVEVVPTSNDQTDAGGQYNIGFSIDDRLLSHRFDVKGSN